MKKGPIDMRGALSLNLADRKAGAKAAHEVSPYTHQRKFSPFLLLAIANFIIVLWTDPNSYNQKNYIT